MDCDINNEVGTNSLAMKNKMITKDECRTLCDLMIELKVKTVNNISSMAMAPALQGSYITEADFEPEQMERTVMNWIEDEDDKVVNEMIITEEIERLEIVERDDDQENEELTDSESEIESEVEIMSSLQMYACLNDVKNYCDSKKLPEKIINQLEKLRWSMRKRNLEKSKQNPSLHKYFAKV